MVNISGGGMGLIVQKESLPSFRQSKMFACEINLTMDRDQLQFALRAQAMHSTVGRKGDVYVGMAFVFDDPTHQRETVDKLVKYTAWVQREQLKNKHQKT
jgi:c-di-GMP-binding flagellar brake protein YcgR